MSSSGTRLADARELDQEMLVELVHLHAQALLRMPWVQSGLVLGIGLFVYPYLKLVGFLAWAVLTIGVEVLRARYAARVLRRERETDARRIHALFVALAALSGATIAAGSVLLLPRLPILHQALFGAILFALPAAGAAVSQSSRYILGAYALAFLPASSWVWGMLHPSQAVGLGALTLVYCLVIILVAADGEKLLLRSVAIRHERDRLVRDLEQRNADVEAAVALAEQSAQARARVLAAASHDLRQPLHALSVYSAVLASGPAPDLLAEVSQNIGQIVRSLGNLLNGLLDLSRLSAGYYVPEHQHVALDRLVAEVCAEYEPHALHKGLEFVRVLRPVALLGDPVAISRMARNLIDNAIKYTESGTVSVWVDTEQRGADRFAVLGVSDSGRGIPEAEQARIFEEFYQLDNPGRDRTKGVGLGLAIVQRLCELTGARIEVQSALGRGTTFRVTMSATVEAARAFQQPLKEKPAVPLASRRVYLVDDELDILRSMRTLLTGWWLRVWTAISVRAAEELFAKEGVPDLMIVDLRLGDSDHGAKLADRLQQHYGHFPVLVITGETSSEALREANERSHTLLQKPISAELLRRTIESVLALPAAFITDQSASSDAAAAARVVDA